MLTFEKKPSDNRYYFYTNNTLTSQGTFAIKTENSIVYHKEKAVIDFSSALDMMIENIDNKNLSVTDNAYDGAGSLYTRK